VSTLTSPARPSALLLDQDQIIQTLSRLRDRIAERFPGSGLSRVSDELLAMARATLTTVEALHRPNWIIRISVGIAITFMITVVVVAVSAINVSTTALSATDVVQAIESTINDLIFLGAAIFFLVTLEGRFKRKKAMRVLHQLRSIVHIVDMHQLTKDPERLMSPQLDTASSPVRTMTGPELGRYLDYCSELLSLSSKIAALFVQRFDDPVVLGAVNEIETLATGLSGKVWQKITLLERATARERDTSVRFRDVQNI
jgi:hypothetical protein